MSPAHAAVVHRVSLVVPRTRDALRDFTGDRCAPVHQVLDHTNTPIANVAGHGLDLSARLWWEEHDTCALP